MSPPPMSRVSVTSTEGRRSWGGGGKGSLCDSLELFHQFTDFCIPSSKPGKSRRYKYTFFFFLSAQLCLPLISVLPVSLVPEASESPFLEEAVFYDV